MQGRLFQLGLVNVHHDDLCRAGPGLPVVADLADRNARAYGQNQVCVLDSPVARAVTHVPGAPAVQRIVILDEIHGVPVGDDGDVELFRHGAERRIPAGQADAIARVEHGSFGVLDFFQNRPDRGVVHRRGQLGVILGGVVAAQLVSLDVAALEVDRDVQPDRAGAARCSQMPRLFQQVANVLGVLQHGGELRHILDGLGDVVLLVAHGAQRRTGVLQGVPGRGVIAHLAGDDEHGDGVQPAAHDTGQRVGAAGAGGHADRRDLIFQPGVGFRRNGAGLLMVVVGHMQPRVMAQRIVQVHSAAAHDRENIRHTARRQKVRHIIR